MPEKKKKGRRAYLDSFQKDDAGKYAYAGKYYRWQGTAEERRRQLGILWALGIASLAAEAAALCVDAPGAGGCAYVLLPGVLGFLFCISVCWGLGRLCAGGNPLRAYIYEASVQQLPGRALGTAIGSGLSAAGELAYILRNGTQGKGAGTALFLLLEIISLAAALGIRRRAGRMEWELSG